jgi:hypothetical protein
MHHSTGSTIRSFGLVHRALAVAALAGGCAAQDAGAPVFGGQGAVVDPGSRASAVEAKPARGPCEAPAPASEDARLDDFEDGDHRLFSGFEREGWWFTATDHTQGGTVFPPDGKFEPVKLGAEATLDNQFAAHLTGSGYTDWGISWGVTLQHVSPSAKCPLNVGSFAGIRLRARGKGTVLMRFGMPETTAAEFGGSCTDKCWDLHSYPLRLSEEWQTREIRWDQLQQGGWGKSVRFDPRRLLSLQFAAKPEYLPADVWLDDIEWLRAAPAASVAAPAAPKGS